MIVAQIDRDYLDVGDRVGTIFTRDDINNALAFGELDLTDAKHVRFRLRDEDNEVHYGGWLLNDTECLVQEQLSNWGARDTGGFIIEVRDNSEQEWRMEIG